MWLSIGTLVVASCTLLLSSYTAWKASSRWSADRTVQRFGDALTRALSPDARVASVGLTTYTVTPEQVSAAKLQIVLDKAAGRTSSDWTRSVSDAQSASGVVEPADRASGDEAAEKAGLKQ